MSIEINKAALEAFAAQHNLNMQQLLVLDSETGSNSKAPKLLDIGDYPHWKSRFAMHINGVDSKLMDYIENGYVHPVGEDGLPIMPARMNEAQRAEYDKEKKAYWTVNQAIPKDLFHQFERFESAKELWDQLEKHCEGEAEEKNLKKKRIKKEFDNFMAFEGEGITALVNRFYHLLSEMHKLGVTTTAVEQIEQLAEGLPAGEWRNWYEIKKEAGTLRNLDINSFVAKLRMREQDINYRAKKCRQIQDTSLYVIGSTPSAPVHAPLKTAFSVSTSNTQSDCQAHHTISSSSLPKPRYSTTDYSTNASQSTYSTNASPSTSSTPKTVELNTANFGKTNVSVITEHVDTLQAMVASFDRLIANHLVNNNLTVEDYAQIDSDDMERLDIIWAMASVSRRSKEYEKKTGKKLNVTLDQKFGFDKSKVRCYNCQELGHFARECEKPKRPFNQRSPFTPTNNTTTMVPVTTGNSDGSSSSGNNQRGMVTSQFESAPDWNVSFQYAPDANHPGANVAKIEELNEDAASEAEDADSSSCSEIVVSENEGEPASTEGTSTAVVLMANIPSTSATPVSAEHSISTPAACSNCVDLEAVVHDLQSKKTELKEYTISLEQQIAEQESVIANMNDTLKSFKTDIEKINVYKNNDKQLRERNESLSKQVSEMSKTVLNKQDAITFYINCIDSLKKENAILKVNYETLDQKLKSYASSSYIITHMLDSSKKPGDTKGISYNNTPPPFMNDHTTNPSPNQESDYEYAKIPKVDKPVSKPKNNGKGINIVASSEVVEECETLGLGSSKEPVSSVHSQASSSKPNNQHKPKSNKKSKPIGPISFVKEGENKQETNESRQSQKVSKDKNVYISPPRRVDGHNQFQRPQNAQNRPLPREEYSPRRVVVYNDRTCFYCGSKDHLINRCADYYGTPRDRPRRQVDLRTPNESRGYGYNSYSKRPSPPRQYPRVYPMPPHKPGDHKLPISYPRVYPLPSKPNDQKVPVSSGRTSPPKVIKQSTVYHKQSLNTAQAWKSKSNDKSETSTSDSASSKSTNFSTPSGTGVWALVQVIGDDGKPKTIRAWVPIAN